VLLYHIGLGKDHVGHPVNQPHLLLFEKCWKRQLEVK